MTDTDFIRAALAEDIGPGDYSTLAAIEPQAAGKAILKVKEDGILAGMDLAEKIVHFLEPEAQFRMFRTDSDRVAKGDIAFELNARVHTLLQAERLLLNCAQRMSGIATLTSQYVAKIKDYKAKVLDTRKTTPLFRKYEKQAVAIGGGVNHRMGLYDMVMLKDNHIDFCGGIAKALQKTRAYLEQHDLPLKIEIETRSLDDVRQVLDAGGADRIMLDNYAPELVAEAVQLISGSAETEASGGIHIDNIIAYAQAGVDFISVGAIIHHAVSLDLSLKAQLA
ncbi:MAG: carboxylating nicotinate-nucleotide diphosphorylase [Sphingobacteriales bacterium]|nr:MAG: carboxylating nicotinate-nucleotide diphosphorylase [Sphingobacteriales bacterium]